MFPKPDLRTLGLVLAMAVVSFALANQFTMWHMEARPSRVAVIQEVVDAFNAGHPEYAINVEVQGWGEVFVQATAALLAGRPPDFMFTTPDLMMNLHLLGGVQPATSLMEDLLEQYSWFEPAVDPYYFDDEYWAVPLYGMAEVLWYRRDLFEQAGLDPDAPPSTWSELLETADALTASGVVEYPIAVAGDWHLATTQQIYPLMVVNRAEHIFDADGNIVFDNPRTVEAYAMYKKLFEMSPPGSEAWQWDQPIAALVEGRVAMVIEKGQYTEQWDLRTDLPPEYLGAAPIPQPDEDGQRATVYYSNAIKLMSLDPEAHEAFEVFVRFLTEPENHGHLLTAAPGFFLPVTDEAAQSATLMGHPVVERHMDKFELMIEESRNGMLYGFTKRPYHPFIGRVMAQDIFAWAAHRMVLEDLSPEEAVRLGAERIARAIR